MNESINNNYSSMEKEVSKPDAVRELELLSELRRLKACLKPIAKNGRCNIGKDRGYDYFHMDDILETINTVIDEHDINVAIWQEIKYEIIGSVKINYIETVFVHTKNGYKHIIKTDLNMGETLEVYKLDMQFRSEYANLTKTERRQANNTIQQVLGASFTYFCRYVLVKFFGIIGLVEDNDCNFDGKHTSKIVSRQQAVGQTQAKSFAVSNNFSNNNSNNNDDSYSSGYQKRNLDTPEERKKLYSALDKLAEKDIASKIKFYVSRRLISVSAGWFYGKGFKDKMQDRINSFSKLEHKFKDRIEEMKRAKEQDRILEKKAIEFTKNVNRYANDNIEHRDSNLHKYSNIEITNRIGSNSWNVAE
ncbi:hypothetical protein F0310_05060 (plasmid) [Borrelia sp. A-FGy1]|uniref:ERF family protein n=1 Tax=Borrelia sp. A-FGy1 TaxID=2608247 RepID=UPI0015F646B6|nr:ERF family protein [Borrelia sp. A-FGy1]QMU99787.1 hypothetical protein F0310_05060 [Borrelia sp. A-FGy1]